VDPRRLIQLAVESEEYFLLEHAVFEADKDGVSQDQIEAVMASGAVQKTEQTEDGAARYVLRRREITVVVEVTADQGVIVVTVWRDRDG